MLYFVLGRTKSGKTSYIINKISENRTRGGLFLVPEGFSHEMERELCEVCGNSVSLFTEVTNFRRLASKIKSTLGGMSADILDNGDRILTLHAALGDVRTSLSSLSKASRHPDKLSALLSAIDEFKAYGITPEALSKVTPELSESLKKKISDLALIYAAYESRLGEDTFDAYDELAYVAKALSESDFFAGRTIYLDGFSGFTAAQFDIIKSAITRADDVYISLALPKDAKEGDDGGIFDKTLATRARLSSIAESCGVSFSEIYPDHIPEGPIAYLDRALYSDEAIPYPEDTPEITISSSSSIFEEVEICAAHILGMVKNGARFRDFSVAVCSEEYLAICKAVFSRYEIPAYTANPAPLISKPVISLILTALECAARGISTDLVMQYVKSGFSGVSAKSLDIFENYLYTWSPKRYEWENNKDFSKNPDGMSAPQTEDSIERLRIINRVRNKVLLPIKKLSSAIGKAKNGEEFAEALYAFINEIHLPRRISAFAYLENSCGRYEEALEYETLLGILCSAIDSIGHMTSVEKLSPEDFYLLTKLLLSQYELSTIPPTVDCVNITDLEHADGEKCKYRCILGANDGLFPKNEDIGGLLSDNDREELSGFGIELAPGLTERIFEKCRTVHSVLTSAEDGLFVSYLTLSTQGEEMYESQAISRMRKIFTSAREGLSIQKARQAAKIPCFDESIAAGADKKLWDSDPYFSERLAAISQNAKNTRGPIISGDNIDAIFGKKIRLSASRADLFSSCRYAYFLRYGLAASPRARGEVSPLEAGTLMHYVLETVLRRLSDENTYDEKTAEAYAREACRAYLSENLAGAGDIGGRMTFILSEIENTVVAALLDVCREIGKGLFTPSEFELGFSYDGDFPPIELRGEVSEVSFSGKVDRVDTYKQGDDLYFRVVDYKSGGKDFSLDRIVNGLDMQLLLYMFAIEELGEKRFGKVPKSAGAMYVSLLRNFSAKRGTIAPPAKRPGVVLRNMDIIDALERGDEKEYLPVSFNRDGSFSRSSSILSEKEFSKIKNRIKKVLTDIGDCLARGEIEPNPYADGMFSACTWCDYKAVCAFDEERGDCMRKLTEIKARDILTEEDEK